MMVGGVAACQEEFQLALDVRTFQMPRLQVQQIVIVTQSCAAGCHCRRHDERRDHREPRKSQRQRNPSRRGQYPRQADQRPPPIDDD